MISILLADDHDVVRSGLKQLLELEDDIKVVGDVCSGEEAYEAYNKLLPDVLLMDISMPGIGGLGALKRILARDSKAKVIIFSAYQNTTYATQALTNGAKAYVTKTDSGQNILKAIRQAAIGQCYLSDVIAREIALQSMTDFSNPANSLTMREFEIFRLIAEGRSHLDIGKQLNIGQKTVSNYQTTLKQKLNIETAVDFVRLAMHCGIIDSTI